MAEDMAPVFTERPRMVFAFGAEEDSYFIGCGEEMEWHGLPDDLDSILKNRALEVLAIALGENDAFYCRYIQKNTKKELTVTGNLPTKLEFLLNAWWANQWEVPHISFGPSRSFFFQLSSMTAWDSIPKRLEENLLQLRESSMATLLQRAVSLGHRNSYALLLDDAEVGETAACDGVDEGLAAELKNVCQDPERKKVLELAVLSPWSTVDYLLLFKDGSIFYSVPDPVVEVVQKFVKIWHQALMKYNEEVATRISRATTPAPEKDEKTTVEQPESQEYPEQYQPRNPKPENPRRYSTHNLHDLEPQRYYPPPPRYRQRPSPPQPIPRQQARDFYYSTSPTTYNWPQSTPPDTQPPPHYYQHPYPTPTPSPTSNLRDNVITDGNRAAPRVSPPASMAATTGAPNSPPRRRYDGWYISGNGTPPVSPGDYQPSGSPGRERRRRVKDPRQGGYRNPASYIGCEDPLCLCRAGMGVAGM
ncbi:hypothetical protein EX30DRAFT_233557 [Ascodesmis nigricans]|uniref:Uncharacterized protein n=1 Tax=Ascodesmis nigricans TaxID=341454 RepID=A0A4S2MYG6_9PEZI|nr:hypothetical protein EX30DRAFT_233557 [Ascodesmis nigricans]